MRRLNAEHKGHDRPTDVLTFALADRGRAGGRRRLRLSLGGRARGAGAPDSGRARSSCGWSCTGRCTRSAGSIPRTSGGPRRPCGGGRSATWRRSRERRPERPAMMAMLQLFIAPLVAAALTLWAAWLALAAESDADLPRALGGEFSNESGAGTLVAQPARGPSRAARARGRRRRRRGGLVGALPGGGAHPADARRRPGLGARRPAAPAARRGGAGAHRTRPASRGRDAGAVPAAAAPGGVGRRPGAHTCHHDDPAPRRRRRARHAAGRVLAGGHDRGRGDDTADRHRRGRFLGGPRGGHRDPPELRARPAPGLRRASRCGRGRDLRQGHPGRQRRRWRALADAHPPLGLRARGQDARPAAPRFPAGPEPSRGRGRRVRRHGRHRHAGGHSRADRGRDPGRARHRRGRADPGGLRGPAPGRGRRRPLRAGGRARAQLRPRGREHGRRTGAGRVRPGAAIRRIDRPRTATGSWWSRSSGGGCAGSPSTGRLSRRALGSAERVLP